MDTKEKLLSLHKQAMFYRSQGLLKEAGAAFHQMREVMTTGGNGVQDKKAWLEKLDEQIKRLDGEIRKAENPEALPELSSEVQNVIKNTFSFSKDPDIKAMEGAITLAKFGQLGRARKEFEALLDNKRMKVAAAKNIIRCHMIQADLDAAVAAYEKWSAGKRFTSDELVQIRSFLSVILNRAGIDRNLEDASPSRSPGRPRFEEAQNSASPEVLDINAIEIYMENNLVELDVSFQSDNILSFLIPFRNTALVTFFEPGRILENVQFFSDIAIFEGSAVVTIKRMIEAGPRQGDFYVDLSFRTKENRSPR